MMGMRRYVIGIDEVGRGCLAGPVVVVALGFRDGEVFAGAPEILRDSKKMTAGQRLKWAEFISQKASEGKLFFAAASISPERIDKLNIGRAANEAAYRALKKITGGFAGERVSVILDGGLYLKSKKFQERADRRMGVSVKTVIKADGTYREVMMASVFAKVFRDRKMMGINRRFPVYGFDGHKGYGTEAHIKAIKTFGPVFKVHRRSFLRGILRESLG